MRFTHVVVAAALGAVTLSACGGSYSSGPAKGQSAEPIATMTAGAAVKSGSTSLGPVLVSSSGRTIYALTKDAKNKSTCAGACAQIWPPVLVDKGWTAASGLDQSGFSTILRKDGGRQLVDGRWPLYTYSGDTKPGDVNGEGSGGIWFAVGANAKLVKSAPSSSATAQTASGY